MPTILVIEDEQAVRKNIVDMLKAEGFQAIAAADGEIGIQLAQSQLPDLIICDVMMPRLDGYGVLAAIRESPTTATIPFIFLSAKTERSDLRRGMNLGADDYLTKPFTRVELLETVAVRLAKHNVVMELQQKLVEFQQSNSSKDDFVSTVAHELRSPLATMKLAIEMLQLVPDQARRQSYLDVLQSACDREVELVNDLLDLQRLEARTEQSDRELIDLTEWLPKLAETFQIRAQQRQQTLELHLEPGLAPLYSNRSGLQRILSELCHNACKYTPPGGNIRLQAFAKTIDSNHPFHQTLTACPVTAIMCMVISNEAEIPAAALPQLFERFYRVPNSDLWQQGGTGLGLSLVKKLVETLGGIIEVTSEMGWTHFTLQFPNHQHLNHQHPNHQHPNHIFPNSEQTA